jgi:hypothetical protein
MKEARIQVLTNEPDYSDYQDPGYDWSLSVCLSKQWAYALVWQTMNALLFARGDTWDLLDDECGED